MHSAEEAKAYVSELHKLMVYAGVTYGNLYHGNMRFDVNISVAKRVRQSLESAQKLRISIPSAVSKEPLSTSSSVKSISWSVAKKLFRKPEAGMMTSR